MVTNKLFNVLVLGALTLGGCGAAQKLPGNENPGDDTQEAADAGRTTDAGMLVADAGDTTVDAGDATPDAGDEGGGACPWAGMDPCPC